VSFFKINQEKKGKALCTCRLRIIPCPRNSGKILLFQPTREGRCHDSSAIFYQLVVLAVNDVGHPPGAALRHKGMPYGECMPCGQSAGDLRLESPFLATSRGSPSVAIAQGALISGLGVVVS